MTLRKFLMVVGLSLVAQTLSFANDRQYAGYPLIVRLDAHDDGFKQLIDDIAENSRRIARNQPPLPLAFYRYETKPNDSLYEVSARVGLPYDSIATLNHIPHPRFFPQTSTTLFIPNMSGLAVITGETDPSLKKILSRLSDKVGIDATLYLANGGVSLKYFPRDQFTPKERRMFLTGFFRSPIDGNLRITSAFGPRLDPLGSGQYQFHRGIDIGTPTKTPVRAAADGTVHGFGYLDSVGKYVIIDHEGGYQTLYGHLSEVLAGARTRVRAGEKIALSGDSGESTGPHLHFEIRKDGKSVAPLPLLSR